MFFLRFIPSIVLLPARLVFALLALAPLGASGQTTVSLNLDYAEGKYGERERSTAWTLPLIFKHQAGPWVWKLHLPYVRATGTASAGGDRFSPVRQTQEGFGDLTATVLHEIIDQGDEGLQADLGFKAKLATAARRNDLITTGRNDYSLLVDLLQPLGDARATVTLGRTYKEDPEGVDYRNPWFGSLGIGHRFGGNSEIGAYYDYRQALTGGGSPVSEATLYAEWRFGPGYKGQVYLVKGFADASPDFGAGLTLSVRFD